MSEKVTRKKESRKRSSSSSSSSYSSSSSESSNKNDGKGVNKSKKFFNPSTSVNKVKLDIGYKIQQEELSDSDDSDMKLSPRPDFKNEEILKHSNSSRSRNSPQSKKYDEKRHSSGFEKKRNRSRSRDSRKVCSPSKDSKQLYDCKGYFSKRRNERSVSKERRKERSRSIDRRNRRSRSRDKKSPRSRSKDRKKDRSKSRERRRDRSKNRDPSRIKDKRRERSKSLEKFRERSRRSSKSPSYYKTVNKPFSRSKRGGSRERNSKRSRSRSRSRKRSRSRSRSFDRPKRLYDKKLNKLNILEKLGIELKIPEGQELGEAGGNTSGFSIPSYYNPAGVNPLKYAQQMQKRRLIWGNKKQEGEQSEKKEEVKVEKIEGAGPESVWKGTTFSQDQDGKLTAKFKRLMGIKDSETEASASQKNSELLQKQEEMFTSMEKQYEVARVSTHTHRGLGLGFGVHLPR